MLPPRSSFGGERGLRLRRLADHPQTQPFGNRAAILAPFVDRRAAHVALVMAVVVFGAAVEGAAVVPDQDVAGPPFVRVDEAGLGGEADQLLDQRGALGLIHAEDALSVRADEQ